WDSQSCPRAFLGTTNRVGALRTPPVRDSFVGKSPKMPRMARREARAHRATGASQQVRNQPDKTRVTGAPSRRAIPLDSGDGKRERIRANPRARIKTGADFARSLHCHTQISTVVPAQAGPIIPSP